ncbi:MAG: hypothetical protein KGM99_19230, partial [Burkholderiales bacterium]|nr:hypothetical protein [Burkholderiales bacterium]
MSAIDVKKSNVLASLNSFSSETRLYELRLAKSEEASESDLLIEAFISTEALNGIGYRELIVLSTNAQIEQKSLIGQIATLEVSLSDARR